MDADILRLILILLGGLLILGIYLWERRKRADNRIHAVRHDAGKQRVEPTLGGAEPASVETPETEAEELNQALHELGDLVSEERKPPQPTARKQKAQQSSDTRQQDLFAEDATVDSDHYQQADPDLPSMILQILISGKGDRFEGPDLRRVMEGVEMHPGKMRLYHRHDGKGKQGPVLFSVASMVEPGTFPFDAMEEFSTPGLALFAQLPGPRDGLAVFSDMLFTAERIASQLDGELLDGTRSVLTRQTIEHIRSEILEHRRRVQLAKSKKK